MSLKLKKKQNFTFVFDKVLSIYTSKPAIDFSVFQWMNEHVGIFKLSRVELTVAVLLC